MPSERKPPVTGRLSCRAIMQVYTRDARVRITTGLNSLQQKFHIRQ
jgi:hypothetical protein